MRMKTVIRFLVLFAAAALAACGLFSRTPVVIATPDEPVIFVHGNGDSSLLWITTAWRFESNGWQRDRLFAFDLPHPVSRDLNDVEQPNRTSAEEYTAFLAAKVAEVKRQTGASKVILIGNSRGGYPIRRFLRDGGAASVSHAILGGTPNHGVSISTTVQPTNEYNGAGPWLTALNSPQGDDGLEVTTGVRFLTLRSDHNDLYAQPLGTYIGMPQVETHVSFDAPALNGATNLVLPGADHRETAYSVPAFNQIWQFLTGKTPVYSVRAEVYPVFAGRIFAVDHGAATNQPLAGTHLQIFPVDLQSGARTGASVLDVHVGDDGRWGPVILDPEKRYEFAMDHVDYSVTHVYFGALLRSTSWLNLTLQPQVADPSADSVVVLKRPSGYFDAERDTIVLDGTTPKEIRTPVPTKSQTSVTLPPADAMRPVVGRYDDELIVAPAWPGRDGKGASQRVVEEMLD